MTGPLPAIFHRGVPGFVDTASDLRRGGRKVRAAEAALVYSPPLAVVSTAAAAQGVSAGDAVVQDARTHSPAAAGYANA